MGLPPSPQKGKLLLVLIIFSLIVVFTEGRRRRPIRSAEDGWQKVTSVPLSEDEIDLATIEGIEKVTKLVFIKTNSLPGESDETINGRYLNSLMETLYTGLRKPFKSVSADILGIFPTFEEIQVRCDRSSSNENLERDESIIKKRGLSEMQSNQSIFNDLEMSQKRETQVLDDKNNSANMDNDVNYVNPSSYKSPLQVCQAVTGDCLSTENLVQLLPPSITSFDKALVRLCPVVLFRIMNHLCHKQSNTLDSQHDELLSGQKESINYDGGSVKQDAKKETVTLNTLLRESQILKTLQNSDDIASKRPQKLHKKLKTHNIYTSNGRMDEEEKRSRIRLKLTEPSIEKVWIFSLLFVVLSIVVSMGGLIVLPFVRKTTRRRILTLFEGLAVGGLAGSATLHMFPQAFRLVDENYRKYFWRIFVVFLGIYLCYLCERVIKITKVMRARIKRRSRASLIDLDYRYGFPPDSYELRSSKIAETSTSRTFQSLSSSRKSSSMMNSKDDPSDTRPICCRESNTKRDESNEKLTDCIDRKGSGRSLAVKRKGLKRQDEIDMTLSDTSFNLNIRHLDGGQPNPTKQRLIQCLKSVQEQFSPVYEVPAQTQDDAAIKDESKANRLMRLMGHDEQTRRKEKNSRDRKGNLNRDLQSFPFRRSRVEARSKTEKKHRKQREVETMLYHQEVIARQNLGGSKTERDYIQQRLSSINDVAAERQDQDNAARMSVDTVAWMIVFGDAVLNVIDGLSIGAAFERNILAGISISVAVMLEEVTHRLGTFAVLIRAGMSMQQSLLCTFLSACALFPGLIVGILLSDRTEDATPYIFCAAGGIFLYMVSRLNISNAILEIELNNDLKIRRPWWTS